MWLFIKMNWGACLMYVFGVCSHLFGQNRPINPWLLKQNNNLHPVESSEGLICYYCLLVALKRASSYINLYSSKVRAWNGFLNVSQTIHFSVTVWAVYGHRWCWLIRIIAFLFSFFFNLTSKPLTYFSTWPKLCMFRPKRTACIGVAPEPVEVRSVLLDF